MPRDDVKVEVKPVPQGFLASIPESDEAWAMGDTPSAALANLRAVLEAQRERHHRYASLLHETRTSFPPL